MPTSIKIWQYFAVYLMLVFPLSSPRCRNSCSSVTQFAQSFMLSVHSLFDRFCENDWAYSIVHAIYLLIVDDKRTHTFQIIANNIVEIVLSLPESFFSVFLFCIQAKATIHWHFFQILKCNPWSYAAYSVHESTDDRHQLLDAIQSIAHRNKRIF